MHSATKSAARAAAGDWSDPLPVVRQTVRTLLLSCPAYAELEPEKKRALAEAMVKVCHRAATLLREEIESDSAARQDDSGGAANAEQPRPPLARAQTAGSEYSGVSASRVAQTTRDILNAVSFPRFVTELINGVFKAMVDSSRQQMQSYVELLNNVAASTDGFADSNLGADRARQWLAERYPASFVIEGESAEDRWEGEAAEPSEAILRLRPGAALPSPEALRVDLGLGPDESVPTGDPERAIVPLARRALSRQRQQMLATMVMLGMQRIVIDSGRIHASMRFHIDTRSAAQEDRGSQLDARHTSTVSGSFGYGPWGASASMTNTIGYVSTQRTQTTEEMNTDLDLNSSVELVFKTDYLPLERMAGHGQIERIKVNTLNPEAEAKAAAEARGAREKRYAESEKERRGSVDKSIAPPPTPPAAPKPGEPGSVEAADKAKKDAAAKAKPDDAAKKKADEDAAKKKAAEDAAKKKTTPAPTPDAKKANMGDSSAKKTTPPAKPPPKKATSASLGLGSERPGATHPTAAKHPDVVFVPTPEEGVDEMLALARVGPDDLVYDLGCGDGRVVVAAARKHGCLATGFDVDPKRIAEARARVLANNVGHLVSIEQRDLFTVDLSEADVVFIYLLPELNTRLLPQLDRMKPGARIVSHDFSLAGVIPDRVVQVFLPRHGIYKTFFLWTTPLKRAPKPVRHQWSNSQGIVCSRAGQLPAPCP